MEPKKGPLSGVTIIEMVGIGPGPFAGMLFADMGARVIAIDRKGNAPMLPTDINRRGKQSIALNLKKEDDIAIFKAIAAKADAVFEGFRPGVMEKMGLGPNDLMADNPALVYGRMTGWGQTGPMAEVAGHDINYIARSGVLGSLGTWDQPPTAPLNLVGDYGGGAMFLVTGMLAALLEAKNTGKGRVVDAAMVDGSALLMSLFSSLEHAGLWDGRRGSNMLSGSAPFYGTYETKDGKYMAVGSIEPQFAKILYKTIGLEPLFIDHMSMPKWPQMQEMIKEAFLAKTQDEWAKLFEGTDACVNPVLSYEEAASDSHMKARATYVEAHGVKQPAPAPRFSGDSDDIGPPAKIDGDREQILRDFGIEP